MDDYQITLIKLECLKLAVSVSSGAKWSGDTLIECAGDMSDFVFGIEHVEAECTHTPTFLK